LGFLAGLWLAPTVARYLPGMVVMAVLVPATVIVASWGWRGIPWELRMRLPQGWEGIWLVPVVLLGAWLSLKLGMWLEAAAMRGDFRLWLYDVHGLSYDVRNSIVIGIAMGFAVIPIIFSISEDA